VLRDLGQLVGAGQRAHVVGEREARAEPHALELLGEARHEGVVDGVVHVDALDADAQLAAVGGDALHGAGDGAPQRRVGQHQEGVLAAELHCAALELLAALRGDFAPCGRRAGEHDEVGVLDERRTELRAAAGDHLEQAGGQPRLFQQPGRPEAGERRLRVGLEHDAVAGDQRREGVADAERERVVPRRDDADHAARAVVHPGGGEDRQGALGPPWPEELLRDVAVVARLDGDVEHLLERVDARLAALELDEVEDLRRVREHQVVVAQEHGGALCHRQRRPLRLCRARGCTG
jgi:ParB family chromosome partitioning protein